MVVQRTYREVSTISPLGSLYVIIPIILGIAVLGEDITIFKIFGVVASCISILCLGTKDVRQLLFCLIKTRPSQSATITASVTTKDLGSEHTPLLSNTRESEA